ncbi:glycosyltransferase [Candidatus Palauibacter sp.]|uniref:glycosyltransferase n=1 Tax=Candidatus Palauibacter sp. TaxID=3101350 RepID=UPI003AF2CEFF
MSEIGQVAYLALLALLAPFGAHRLRLLWLRVRRPARTEARTWRGPLPMVTVQLPVFNEANVIERVIDAACRLDYPADRLEIQVLDDSEDETTQLASRRVRFWHARGVGIRHVRRASREGFKAGALAHGVATSRGDFLLVLDADFVPPAGLIRDLLPPFDDPEVGAVQAAWEHLSPDATWLTRAQALFLDAHFAIEHEARYRAGLFFNFNGSAGMWRKDCVEAAGGWQSDTLTEDVDLSYRAQLAGWRFVYRDNVRVPAELPSSLRAVEIQQSRWTQGGIQSARKLLPRIWRQRLPMAIKFEATAHLVGHVVHPLTLTMAAALAATGWLARPGFGLPSSVHAAAVLLATVPFVLFYGAAGSIRKRRRLGRRIVEALLLGLGLGVPLTFAVLRGCGGRETPFARTPKRGFAPTVAYRARLAGGPALLRVALAVALVGAVVNAALLGLPAAVPFTGLFAAGYALASRESLRMPPAPAIPG